MLTESNGELQICKQDFVEKWHSTDKVKEDSSIRLGSLLNTSSDKHKIKITAAVESQRALYFLDFSNNSVKQLAKVYYSDTDTDSHSDSASSTYTLSDSCTAYTPVFPPGCKHLVSSICLFDQQTLALLCVDGVVVFVHADTMHYLYSFTYRHTSHRIFNPRLSFIMATDVKRLFVAHYNRCTKSSVKVNELPSGE